MSEKALYSPCFGSIVTFETELTPECPPLHEKLRETALREAQITKMIVSWQCPLCSLKDHVYTEYPAKIQSWYRNTVFVNSLNEFIQPLSLDEKEQLASKMFGGIT